METVVVAVGTVISGTIFLILSVVGARAFFASRSREKIIQQFVSAVDAAEHPAVDEALLAQSPDPVKRYFDKVLDPEGNVTGAAVLHLDGRYRLDEKGQWLPAVSHEIVSGAIRGYYSSTRIAMGWAWVRIQDAYRDRIGEYIAKYTDTLCLADSCEVRCDLSNLARYLAVSVWFPHALLPGRGVQWDEIDAESARVTITDGNLCVSGVFTFNEMGLVHSFTTEDRYRLRRNGSLTAERWQMIYTDYKRHDGIMIPQQVEFAWLAENAPAFSYSVMQIKTAVMR